jgi:integrase
MATLEHRGNWFRVIFRFNGKRYAKTLNTQDAKKASILKGGIEKTILLLQQNLLRIPEGTDVLTFIVNGGEVPTDVPSPTKPIEPVPERNVVRMPEQIELQDRKQMSVTTLKLLCDRYANTLALSVEQNSLSTVQMHLRHVVRFFGSHFDPARLAPAQLQEYIEHRAKKKGILKRPLSAYTIRKELTTFRAAWNWAVQMRLIETPFPAAPLKYPKMREKLPFQTWAEIERKVAFGVTPAEAKELWDCLFLDLSEIDELLKHVSAVASQPFIYPMFCFAAHTGARRSELLRLKKSDMDLDSDTVLIHEKKRMRGMVTTRRVSLSPFLKAVLRDWLQCHPGGLHLFTQQTDVFRSNKRRTEPLPITHDEASDHFKRTLAGSKWEKLRGWHVFRHSFISNCAAKNVDQRIIDEWVGHQTEEMRRRYRHLFPHQQQAAIRQVFGDGKRGVVTLDTSDTLDASG